VNWQVQNARQRFSEPVQRALDEGPQFVTRRGKDLVVVLVADEYRRLTGGVPDFKAFLQSAPDLSELELDTLPRDVPREVDV